MNDHDRATLRQLVENFERGIALCRRCCKLQDTEELGPLDLCDKCRGLFELAYDFEEAHVKYGMNDDQIRLSFKQVMERELDEEELELFKCYMLEYECEDSTDIVDAIKKIVMSLKIHHPEIIEKYEL